MNAAYNPVIVDCLRILARRGRAIRQAQEAAAEGASLATEPSAAAGATASTGSGAPVILCPARETASGGGQ
jgi:hypothetical protein